MKNQQNALNSTYVLYLDILIYMFRPGPAFFTVKSL